ncbi:Reducing polyketide synthase DEP5 [Clarias magur]|uniref:Reducing polyketide synthase DEP5 n=1 Tax=Clarias magur TaxID=1594786 RepID=A0A8J4UJE1_CLAMG|nr:Reducing polyketide synthase DEP5 [Clarias magur]
MPSGRDGRETRAHGRQMEEKEPSIQHQKNSTKHPPGDMTNRVQGDDLLEGHHHHPMPAHPPPSHD